MTFVLVDRIDEALNTPGLTDKVKQESARELIA